MDIRKIDGAVICKIPDDDEINKKEIQLLTESTSNTWQPGRNEFEKSKNTIMGKKAELVLERFLSYYCELVYQSYDSFRSDGFKKHAPFDGIIYSKTIKSSLLDEYVGEIKKEIMLGGLYGKISVDLRKKLEDSHIFTVEVKSSNLKNGDFDGVENVVPRDSRNCAKIIKNIAKRDFFVYPHYLRTTDTISDFYEYAEYVRINVDGYRELGNRKALEKLIQTEYEHASDIYTRLYFDVQASDIYIPGYILKEDFFKNPYIGKMPGLKSGKALYYMHSIADRSSFIDIDNDKRIKSFVRLESYQNLFAHRMVSCPKCNNIMQICNNPSSKNYYYKCYSCGTTSNI